MFRVENGVLPTQNGVLPTKDLYSIDRGDDANHESATSRPIELAPRSVEFLDSPSQMVPGQDTTQNS